jgi:hypothetical protein
MVRGRYFQITKKGIGQGRVVVLSGMDDAVRDLWALRQFAGKRSQLDKVGTRADDATDIHAGGPVLP